MVTHVPICTSPRSARGPVGVLVHRPLAHQAVELPGVLAGDLVHDIRRQMAELLLDVLRRLGQTPSGCG